MEFELHTPMQHPQQDDEILLDAPVADNVNNITKYFLRNQYYLFSRSIEIFKKITQNEGKKI